MQPFHVYAAAFGLAFLVTIVSIPIVKKIAVYFRIVDRPNARKVHTKQMPRLGGISILFGFIAGFICLFPHIPYMPSFLLGAFVIVLTGVVDDKFSISAKAKLAAQITAATIFVTSGPLIDFVNIPFVGYLDFGWFSYPITVFWIVTMTNAINLIDGLDGLASGVSSIALCSLLVMAILNQQALVISLIVILLGSTLGFLIFNFHPAQIFMGDGGSMFIGYTIAVISIIGLFKSVTLFSLLIPVMILAVPIFDTVFAVIRRLIKKQKLTTPDKAHLHHSLMALGFSHRGTVLIIYAVSSFFGAAAILFSKSFLWGSLLIAILSLIMIQFFVELAGVLNHRRKPIIDTVKRLIAMREAARSQK